MTEANSNSEYNNLLEALRNRRKNEAKTEIPKFCDVLRKEDPKMLPSEIRKKVERDMKEFWSERTVSLYLPEEYKHEEKVKAGRIGSEKKKEMILVTNSAAMTAAEPSPVEPKEPEARTFTPQPERPKKQTYRLNSKTCKGWPCERDYIYEIEVDGENVTRMYAIA